MKGIQNKLRYMYTYTIRELEKGWFQGEPYDLYIRHRGTAIKIMIIYMIIINAQAKIKQFCARCQANYLEVVGRYGITKLHC